MSESEATHKEAKADAKAAKARAKATRPWFKKKRFWLLGFIVLSAISSAIGGGGDSSTTSASSDSAEVQESAAPAAKVTAETLLSNLDENALSAKNTWDGQIVELTGTLDNIDASGNYFSLRGNSEFSLINIQVFIDDKFIDTVSSFTKGQKVTVTGEITDVGELLGYSVDAISIP